jgi:hypothetical protein
MKPMTMMGDTTVERKVKSVGHLNTRHEQSHDGAVITYPVCWSLDRPILDLYGILRCYPEL